MDVVRRMSARQLVLAVAAVLVVVSWASCMLRSPAAEASDGYGGVVDFFEAGALRAAGDARPDSGTGVPSGLHKASQWVYMNDSEWAAFVDLQVAGLRPPLDGSRPVRVLEVGSGVGAFALRLLQLHPGKLTYYGVDPSITAVRVSRRALRSFPNVVLGMGDVRLVPFADEFFDHALAPGCLCLLPTLGDVEAAVVELVRVLRRGGSGMFSVMARSKAGKGSCKTIVPSDTWAKWGAAHGFTANVMASDFIVGQRERDIVFVTKLE